MRQFKRVIETTSEPTKPSRFKRVIAKESEPSITNGSLRKPSVEVCGHKPYGLFSCGLPKGHTGACSKVEPCEVDPKIVRQIQFTTSIPLSFDRETIPQELTDIIYAWKKTGNNWGSALETELAAFSKGLKFQYKVDNPYAVGCLMFLGYMDAQPPNPHDRLSIRRYRLSKKGLEAAETIARMVGDTQYDPMTNTTVQMNEEVDCNVCEGSGISESGELCNKCEGQGVIIKRPTYRASQIRKEVLKEVLNFNQKRKRGIK